MRDKKKSYKPKQKEDTLYSCLSCLASIAEPNVFILVAERKKFFLFSFFIR